MVARRHARPVGAGLAGVMGVAYAVQTAVNGGLKLLIFVGPRASDRQGQGAARSVAGPTLTDLSPEALQTAQFGPTETAPATP
jgi:hypothetical protein